MLGKRPADSDEELSEAEDEEYSVSDEASEQEEKPGRFKRPLGVKEERALAKVAPKKEVSKMTFIDIIEDTKSGVPAKSEIESRDKRAYLRKQGETKSLVS